LCVSYTAEMSTDISLKGASYGCREVIHENLEGRIEFRGHGEGATRRRDECAGSLVSKDEEVVAPTATMPTIV